MATDLEKCLKEKLKLEELVEEYKESLKELESAIKDLQKQLEATTKLGLVIEEATIALVEPGLAEVRCPVCKGRMQCVQVQPTLPPVPAYKKYKCRNCGHSEDR